MVTPVTPNTAPTRTAGTAAYMEALSTRQEETEAAKVATDITVMHEFIKETATVKRAVDTFFGVQQGFRMLEIKNITTNAITLTIDKNTPNVFGKLEEYGVMLCGGAINSVFTDSQINDLDLYIRDPEQHLGPVTAWLETHFKKEFETTNAITFSRKSNRSNKRWRVQLIKAFKGEPAHIFDCFDFTITHGAYDFSKQRFFFGPRFFADLSKRKLVFSGYSKYPICAMYRTKKYVDRGYNLPGATIMHIALCIVQLQIRNYGELKTQLMGIDTIYLQRLLGKYAEDAPVDYGQFVEEAFKAVDGISGMTLAEEEEV